MTLSLQEVRPEDAELLHRLTAARRPELATLPDPLLAMQAEAQRREYAARFPGAEDRIIVRDDRPVGRLWVHRDDRVWRLLDIVVLADERGAGVGTAVLTDLLAEADRAGALVLLTIDAGGEAARRLYARLGFTTVFRDPVQEVMERRPRGAGGPPATG